MLKKDRFGIPNNFLYHYIEVRNETLWVADLQGHT